MTTTTAAPLAAQCRIDTPLGPLTLAATANGLAAALFDAQSHHPGPLAAPVDPAHPLLVQAARDYARYFAGRGADFTVPLAPQGTPWQQRVWRALLAIAPGRVTTYGKVAAALGRAGAARAVGAAVARNPIAVAIPCHRVVGSDGSLTGYAAGLDRKRALLALEQAAAGNGAHAVRPGAASPASPSPRASSCSH